MCVYEWIYLSIYTCMNTCHTNIYLYVKSNICLCTWGPPKPRKAVLVGRLVRHTRPRTCCSVGRLSFEFRVSDFGLRVWGLGFGVRVSGFRVGGWGLGVSGLEFWVGGWGLRMEALHLEVGDRGSGVWVWGLGFGVWVGVGGLGLKAYG